MLFCVLEQFKHAYQFSSLIITLKFGMNILIMVYDVTKLFSVGYQQNFKICFFFVDPMVKPEINTCIQR